MAIDFTAVLAALDKPRNIERVPPVIKPELLAKWANYMARRGYQHTETSLAALEAYLQGYGVALCGDLGTGKTMFFAALDVPTISMLDLAGEHIEDVRQILGNYYDKPLHLDDVGKEPKGRDFGGGEFEYLAFVLEDRLRRNQPTYITMNMNETGFIKRYGDLRLLDRIYELCKPFVFKGKSKRHAKAYKSPLER